MGKKIENSFLLYMLLCLAFMNFLGKGTAFYLVFCFYGLYKVKSIGLGNNIITYITLVVLTFGAVLSSLFYFEGDMILKSFLYLLSFLFGYNVILKCNDPHVVINRIMLSSVIGILVFLGLVYFFNFKVLTHISGQRILFSIWTGEEMSVTLVGLVSSLPICYSIYCFFCKKNIIYYMIGFVSLLLPFVLNIETATRTPLVLAVLVYLLMLLKLYKSSSIKIKKRIVYLIIVVAFFIIFWGLPFLSSSAIGSRLEEEGLKTSRTRLVSDFLDLTFEYPWGGNFAHNKLGIMAHNFLQEAHDMFGLFFSIPLFILFLSYLKNIFYMFFSSNNNPEILLLLSISFGLILSNLMEPSISGYPLMVWLMFIIMGMLTALTKGQLVRTTNKDSERD